MDNATSAKGKGVKINCQAKFKETFINKNGPVIISASTQIIRFTWSTWGRQDPEGGSYVGPMNLVIRVYMYTQTQATIILIQSEKARGENELAAYIQRNNFQ